MIAGSWPDTWKLHKLKSNYVFYTIRPAFEFLKDIKYVKTLHWVMRAWARWGAKFCVFRLTQLIVTSCYCCEAELGSLMTRFINILARARSGRARTRGTGGWQGEMMWFIALENIGCAAPGEMELSGSVLLQRYLLLWLTFPNFDNVTFTFKHGLSILQLKLGSLSAKIHYLYASVVIIDSVKSRRRSNFNN